MDEQWGRCPRSPFRLSTRVPNPWGHPARPLPSQLQSPEQGGELHPQIEYEKWVIPLPDAVFNPRTVMVVATDALLAGLAVLGSQRLLQDGKAVGQTG